MCSLRVVGEVALRATGVDHVSYASECATVDSDAAEDADFLCSVMREGEVGQWPQCDYAQLIGVFGDLVRDELRSVLALHQGLVLLLDGDAVEFLRVLVDAVAEGVVSAEEDALLRAQVNRYLGACDLLRDKRVVGGLLQRPPPVDAGDAQHDLLKPLSEGQRHCYAHDILLPSVRVDNDVLIQLRHGYLSKLPDVHVCMII